MDDPAAVIVVTPTETPSATVSSPAPPAAEVVVAAAEASAATAAAVGMDLGQIKSLIEGLGAQMDSRFLTLEAKVNAVTSLMEEAGAILASLESEEEAEDQRTPPSEQTPPAEDGSGARVSAEVTKVSVAEVPATDTPIKTGTMPPAKSRLRRILLG